MVSVDCILKIPLSMYLHWIILQRFKSNLFSSTFNQKNIYDKTPYILKDESVTKAKEGRIYRWKEAILRVAYT